MTTTDLKRLDGLIEVSRLVSGQSYWCKWCNRHIIPDKTTTKNGGLLFIHDDVYHPVDYVFESGDEHIIQ